jgi:hypothetical protein
LEVVLQQGRVETRSIRHVDHSTYHRKLVQTILR